MLLPNINKESMDTNFFLSWLWKQRQFQRGRIWIYGDPFVDIKWCGKMFSSFEFYEQMEKSSLTCIKILFILSPIIVYILLI